MELYYHKTDGGAEYYSVERGGPRLIVHGAAMLTEKELDFISRGLVSLIRDASDAKKLVLDRKAQATIDNYIRELQALNTKICTMEGGKND